MSDSTAVQRREPFAAPREDLPVASLLVLAMTGFTAILTETLPAGLLPQMAEGLSISQSLAGQTVTVYALGSLIAAIPLTLWTQGWRRKPALLIAIAGFAVFNTITALSTSYAITLAARFIAGMAAGLGWGIVSGYARRMVVERLQGKALAIAMSGTPLALALGVPAGAVFGATVGWRSAFLLMSATTLLLLVWVIWKMPDFPGQPPERRLSLIGVMRTPGVRTVLVVLFLWVTGHNILYTYITPFAALSGLGSSIDVLLLAFGLAALASIWLTGALVDRLLRTLVLASLFAFCATALALALFTTISPIMIATVIVWGLSFGGAATQLQTALADAAGEGVDLANAMLTTVWNSAIAAGGLFGGILLDQSGAGPLAWAALLLATAALMIVAIARTHAFKSGPRTHHLS
jgi:predicted MFS family arabinose efflux permease